MGLGGLNKTGNVKKKIQKLTIEERAILRYSRVPDKLS